jgi:N-acetylmuramoyl-L-alanine amidase
MKDIRIGIIVFLLCSVFYSCSTNKYAKTNKVYTQNVKEMAEVIQEPLPPPTLPPEAPSPKVFVAGVEGKRDDLDWVGTVNFNLRRPDFVIIHHTAQDSTEQTIRTFTLTHTQVSAHYVIGRDGKTYQMLNDYLRAWHAGDGRWGKVRDMNSHSIGIELDNNGFEPFSPVQINSLLRLLDTLKTNYKIPTANFIGHSDISPTRKQDPSVHFPWKILADNGFGLWPDEMLVEPPENFDPIMALRVIGYDTRNVPAAIIAFKRHFIQSDISRDLTPYDLKVLYNIFLKQ